MYLIQTNSLSHFVQELFAHAWEAHGRCSRKCVKEVALDEGISMENLFTKVIQEPSVNPTRMWNRDVIEELPVGVEIISTFRSPIFVPLVRTEQVKKIQTKRSYSVTR